MASSNALVFLRHVFRAISYPLDLIARYAYIVAHMLERFCIKSISLMLKTQGGVASLI